MEPLTVAGTLDSLGAIAEYVLARAAAAGLGPKKTYQLRLAIDEIATNVILHGYQNVNKSGVLNLDAHIDEQSLTIFLEDTSMTYSPTQVLEPDLDIPLEQREPGGLGLYLAIRNVDEFSYRRVGNRNRHTFVMNRHRDHEC